MTDTKTEMEAGKVISARLTEDQRIYLVKVDQDQRPWCRGKRSIACQIQSLIEQHKRLRKESGLKPF